MQSFDQSIDHTLKSARGWYCPKCDKIYFHPDDDVEHEEWHVGVHVWTELAEFQEPTRKLIEIS